MQRDSDEDAWRAIVDNYGDRIELDDQAVVEPTSEPRPEPRPESSAEPGLERLFRPVPQPDDLEDELDEAFDPGVPPPLPRLPPDRLLAWSGLFGSPVVLLVCLILGVHLAPWLGYLLVASFIGGFAYLVVHMPREPEDPWDDGARL